MSQHCSDSNPVLGAVVALEVVALDSFFSGKMVFVTNQASTLHFAVLGCPDCHQLLHFRGHFAHQMKVAFH